MQILNMRGGSVKSIRHVMRGSLPYFTAVHLVKWKLGLRSILVLNQNILFCFPEYAGNIGDALGEDEREDEQNHILELLDKF